MVSNVYGEIAEKLWLKIPKHFEDMELDEHIIMPNHVHGIIIIDSDEEPVGNRPCLFPTRRTPISKITGY